MDGNRIAALARSLTPRRAALGGAHGAGLASLVARFRSEDTLAKKKKRKKKEKCKSAKTRCGKGCCGALSQCVLNICYCTGEEPPGDQRCRDVADALIDLIAEVSGKDPDEIGAQPEEPLMEYMELTLKEREAINEKIEATFEVDEPVPYYEEGIDAAADIIREELPVKG